MTSTSFLKTSFNTISFNFSDEEDKDTKHDVVRTDSETIISNISSSDSVRFTLDIPFVNNEYFEKIILGLELKTEFKNNDKKIITVSDNSTGNTYHIKMKSVQKDGYIENTTHVVNNVNDGVSCWRRFQYRNKSIYSFVDSSDSADIICASDNCNANIPVFCNIIIIHNDFERNMFLRTTISLSGKILLKIIDGKMSITNYILYPSNVSVEKMKPTVD